MVKTFHVLYTRSAQEPAGISLLSLATYQVLRREHTPLHTQTQRVMIHVDGAQPDEPTLHIIALTDKQGGEAFKDTVEWEVVNWLVSKGHLPQR